MKDFSDFRRSNGDPFGGSRKYRFELSRYEGGNWIPVRVDPLPPDGCTISQVIPDIVVKSIVAQSVDLKRHHSIRVKVEQDLHVFFFDVKYIQVSADHLFGSIWISDAPDRVAGAHHPKMSITRVDCRYEEKSEETNYWELLEYMQKYPEVKEHIFEYFFLKLKPKMDKRLEQEVLRS